MNEPKTLTIGIRREDKNRWERRVPLTPEQMEALIREQGLAFQVQSSPLRAFSDDAYARTGADLVPAPPESPIVLGVKEIPIPLLQADRVYVFFSHTIKGQAYNMPMLRRLMELGCSLIDYERIVDEKGRRLVFFGRHAGIAGMMDTLWALGRRLAWEGISTPLATLPATLSHASYTEVQRSVREAGLAWREQGIPESLRPLIVGFAGYGNVSQGAQEVFDLLEPLEVAPEALKAGLPLPGDPARNLYKVVFREEHTVAPADPAHAFDLGEYYSHPELYRSCFSPYLQQLTVLVNGIYWTSRHPRLATLEELRALYLEPTPPRLRVLGDISCDVDGSLQCTVRSTTPDYPIYVWDPATGEAREGFEGQGPVVMAVDNLPCELPVDASCAFGTALAPLLPALARADFSRSFEDLELPPVWKRALILLRGELTPDYRYLTQSLAAHPR